MINKNRFKEKRSKGEEIKREKIHEQFLKINEKQIHKQFYRFTKTVPKD